MTRIAPARPSTRSTSVLSRITRPSSRSAFQHDGGQLRVVLAHRLEAFEHGDAAAEPQVRLRQLDADRPAADDDQVLDALGVVEDRLVGEVGHLVEARDRRHHRRRAGRDDEAPRLDAVIAGRDRILVDELARGLDHAHAEAREALHRVVGRDRRDHALDVVVDARGGRSPASPARMPNGAARAHQRARACPPRSSPWRARSRS